MARLHYNRFYPNIRRRGNVKVSTLPVLGVPVPAPASCRTRAPSRGPPSLRLPVAVSSRAVLSKLRTARLELRQAKKYGYALVWLKNTGIPFFGNCPIFFIIYLSQHTALMLGIGVPRTTSHTVERRLGLWNYLPSHV